MKKKAIKEWHRLNAIYKQAKKAGLESVMLSCLASMNTITRLLGYEPESEQE